MRIIRAAKACVNVYIALIEQFIFGIAIVVIGILPTEFMQTSLKACIPHRHTASSTAQTICCRRNRGRGSVRRPLLSLRCSCIQKLI